MAASSRTRLYAPGLRLPLEHQRSRFRKAQFTGEHQAGRAGAHDDHVGVSHGLGL
jgi:hypothetical protein